eukprot:TRINITY_DN2962_c0_g1_i4.p1 TRINITY_DN2962_c0_g1~~TRINITY_DN2962_c0_g1_i4.p1  ORF type:complete len:434 (+),score=26.70 TRINITY_DN2962_c0_g1_i4:56-1357(+)
MKFVLLGLFLVANFGSFLCQKPFNNIDQVCEEDVKKEEFLLSQTSDTIIWEINGGVDAACERFPYMISLQFKDIYDEIDGVLQFRYLHFCGGTLIAPDLVLSAAHCIYQQNHVSVNDKRSMAASEGLLFEDSVYAALQPCCRHTAGRQRIQAIKYYLPQDYDGDVIKGDDIVILQLEKPFNYRGPYVKYKMPEKVQAFWPLNKYTTIGFGALENQDVDVFYDRVSPLQLALLDELEKDQCNEIVHGQNSVNSIHSEKHLCFKNSTADTCQGDSGGPVLIADWHGLAVNPGNPELDIQVGITSYGPDETCALYGPFPGVYTNVQYYQQWIDDIVTRSKIQPQFTDSNLSSDPNVTTSSPSPIKVPLVSRPSHCYLPMSRGMCDGAIRAYYYDSFWKKCKEMLYGGCGGNRNLFKTKEKCEAECNAISEKTQVKS